MDYRTDSPQLLLDFLSYHETIKAHSQRTVDEYYLDMRNFFRYLKQQRDPALAGKALDEIDIRDVDIDFISRITLTDIYSYLTYLSRDRVQHQNSEISNKGLNAASRARKLATIRSFFNYICNKRHLLEDNPCKDVDTPKQMKSLPRYLTLNESLSLLESVDGANRERDYCILTLFLNCGLRISELIGLDITDIHDDALRVLGKGNKVRVVYLNQACKDALARYMAVRRPITGRDKNALFLSGQNRRISRSMVHALVKKHLSAAGLDSEKYSSHKLRHTAATLMLQNGVDVKDGESLSLGTHTLTFVFAPMVHWPEGMVSYESSEKVLFSADGFGRFGAVAKFDEKADWASEARRYYLNIVGKYGPQVQALLKKAAALDIRTICPLHGPVLTGDLGKYLNYYDIWSSYKPEEPEKILVASASIHGHTRAAAHLMAEKLRAKGAKVVEMDLTRTDVSYAVTEAFRCGKVVLACATYDGFLFPPMENLLTHLKTKSFQNRTVGLMENGTWAPMAAKLMRAELEGMKNITVCENVVTIRSAANAAAEAQMDALAAEITEK